MDSETQKTETLYELLTWLEVNKKRVAIGGAAALLVIGLIATVTWYKKHDELRASEALSNIRLPVGPAETLASETLDQLRKVASDYAGTAAACRAELILAGLLFSSGKHAEAEAAFDKFIREHPENRWVSEAYYGVAVCLDAQNKTNQAVAKYQDFERRFSTDPKADPARLHLATLLEALGRPKEAVEAYDKIVKATTYTPAQGEAQERLRHLLAKYPHLAPSNPPPVTPTLPTLPGTGVVSTLRTNLSPATNPPLLLRTSPPVLEVSPPVSQPVTGRALPK